MLTDLSIHNLRNLSQISLQPSPSINMILGENGSGKTTLLEAIYLLAMGRSFRTRDLKNAIQFDQPFLRVTASISANVPVGVQYDVSSGITIRLNHTPLKKLSDLATQLPLQYVPANCHQFFEQGPRYRRQLLDWGVFHVEPKFNLHWQAYKKILKQRNAALRQHKPIEQVQLWDKQLIMHGEAITDFRKKQLDTMLTLFAEQFGKLCPEFEQASFSLKYKTGWPKDINFEQALTSAIDKDRQLHYTRYGSHAADWSFRVNGADPLEIFSRGQQKLFFLALCLIQTKMMTSINPSLRPILLFDDLNAELDANHQRYLLLEFEKIADKVQVFITTTHNELSQRDTITKFHVEQGVLQTN